MKRLDIGLLLLAGLLILLGVIIVLGSRTDRSEGDPSVWVDTPHVKSENTTEAPADIKPAIPLQTTDDTYMEVAPGLHQISGKVTNTDTVTRSIIVTVTYYDKSDKPIEGGAASYSDIATGTTIDYSVRTGRNVAGFKRFEVKANGF